jgi:hypothetical protein
MTYLAWATTLAPILISFSRSLISVRPWIGMVGRVVGTLQVTDPGKCGKECGTAE